MHTDSCVYLSCGSQKHLLKTERASGMDKEISRWKFHRLILAMQTPYTTHVIRG